MKWREDVPMSDDVNTRDGADVCGATVWHHRVTVLTCDGVTGYDHATITCAVSEERVTV